MPQSTVDDIAGRMVQAAVTTPLMTRLRLAPAAPLTALAAVDLPAIVELTNVEAHPAASAAYSHKNLDNIHARAMTTAL